MKYLLLPVLLCASVLSYAQSKQGSFFKKHLFIKASTSLLVLGKATDRLPNKGDSFTPALFGAVGGKIRYAALGVSAGYFNLKNTGKDITPIGIDLTITDFEHKKAFPVIIAQWHKVNFNADEYAGGSMYTGHSNTHISGKDMYNIGAGVAFRAFKIARILATLGWGRMNSNSIVTRTNPYPATGIAYTKNFKDYQDIYNLTVGVAF